MLLFDRTSTSYLMCHFQGTRNLEIVSTSRSQISWAKDHNSNDNLSLTHRHTQTYTDTHTNVRTVSFGYIWKCAVNEPTTDKRWKLLTERKCFLVLLCDVCLYLSLTFNVIWVLVLSNFRDFDSDAVMIRNFISTVFLVCISGYVVGIFFPHLFCYPPDAHHIHDA